MLAGRASTTVRYMSDTLFALASLMLHLQVGISRIPRSQAARLPNRTEDIPGDEGNFIIELDVFHEIHCLVHGIVFF